MRCWQGAHVQQIVSSARANPLVGQQQVLDNWLARPTSSGIPKVSVLSPRFLSLTKQQRLPILSPEVFSLQNNGVSRRAAKVGYQKWFDIDSLSLTRLLANLSPNEKEIWSQLLLEATGAGESIDRVLKKIDTAHESAPRVIKVCA
jgi:hypothetical protein